MLQLVVITALTRQSCLRQVLRQVRLAESRAEIIALLSQPNLTAELKVRGLLLPSSWPGTTVWLCSTTSPSSTSPTVISWS